jgi:protein-disulfide isomerase
MRRYLPLIIVIVVGLASVASGYRLYQLKRPHILTISSEHRSKAGADESVHIRGNPDAPVTLEEFGDYQCPPCGVLAEPLNQIEHDFSPNTRLIFYNYPLPLHQHAREAACSAEAAGLQGKFWEMHDLIYRQQANWSKAPDAQAIFASYAGTLGLDLERFKKDSQSPEVKARVDADQKKGASIGVQNTPTIFINNHAVAPTDLAPDRLRNVVAAAVKEGGSSPAKPSEPKK